MDSLFRGRSSSHVPMCCKRIRPGYRYFNASHLSNSNILVFFINKNLDIFSSTVLMYKQNLNKKKFLKTLSLRIFLGIFTVLIFGF